MAEARINMRLDLSLKERAERAAALLGRRSLTDYILELVEADSKRVIEKHEVVEVTKDSFEAFWEACNKVSEPNEALKKAAERARDKGLF